MEHAKISRVHILVRFYCRSYVLLARGRSPPGPFLPRAQILRNMACQSRMRGRMAQKITQPLVNLATAENTHTHMYAKPTLRVCAQLKCTTVEACANTHTHSHLHALALSHIRPIKNINTAPITATRIAAADDGKC